MTTMGSHRIAATRHQARAGVSGQHLRHVLLFATIGVIGLFTGVYLYFFA
jgi:hypothetical protein